MAYNHAEQLIDGITIYELNNGSLLIRREFTFSDTDTLIFSKKIDDKAIDRIQSISLDKLENYYFNHCIFLSSGNEYIITTVVDTITKRVELHHYYENQVENLISEVNKSIPNDLKIRYLPSDTEQDCE